MKTFKLRDWAGGLIALVLTSVGMTLPVVAFAVQDDAPRIAVVSAYAPDLLMSREKALETLSKRLNADFYQTLRTRTKGAVSAEDLRGMAAEAEAAASFGETPLREQKAWSFRQSDKVASLEGGQKWYAYLSERFGHGRGVDWKGLSLRGGVVSINRVEDEFAFLGVMSYLARQVAAMNAHAALCPFAGDAGDQWERWVEPALAQQRDVRTSSNALVAMPEPQ